MKIGASKFSWFLIFCIIVVGTGISYTQQKRDPDRERYNVAKQYETIGEFEQALKIYLALLEKQPKNLTYFDAASRCYGNLKRYDNLIQLIKTKLTAEPGNVQFRIRLGAAFMQKGDEDKAHQIWDQMLLENEKNASIYRMVANALIKNRLFDRAIEVYQRGRTFIGQQELFALELAQLHAYRFNYDQATNEYLRYLRASPRQLNYVEARIAAFKGTNETYEQVTSALRDWITAESENPVYRKLLISILLGYENFAEGFAEVKRLERVKKKIDSKEIPGDELFKFSQIALKERQLKFAEKALKEIVNEFPNYPDRAKIEYELARTLYHQKRYDQALLAFDNVVHKYSRSVWAIESVLARGGIFLHEKFSPDSAAQNFLNIVDNFPNNINRIQALIRLGDVEVARGNLQEAESLYLKAVNSQAQKGSTARDHQFEGHQKLAELAFFQGDFEKTRNYLKGLLEVPPGKLSNEFVNDALELSLLVDRNEQAFPQALRKYAHAILLVKQRNLGTAAQELKRVAESFPSAYLAPKAMFQHASLKRGMGDFVASVMGYKTLVGQYPESSVCDLALWQIGDIYETDLQESSKAIEHYETILVNYPESILIENARKKIRSLEAKP